MAEIQKLDKQRVSKPLTHVPDGCSLVRTEHLNNLFHKAYAHQPPQPGLAAVQENDRANSQTTAWLKACGAIALLLAGVSCVLDSVKPPAPPLPSPAPIIIQPATPAPAAPTGDNQNCETNCYTLF